MMTFKNPQADLFIPDGAELPDAVSRTTHLGIGAHPDDLEFWSLHGIMACYDEPNRWFGGITCTDGAGSARAGSYADYTDEMLKQVRLEEQKAAAYLGQYSFIAQLGHSSATAKDASLRRQLSEDIATMVALARPDVIYTHNPFDKHATHVGVFLAVIDALLSLPASNRPGKLLGFEGWRDLDWLPDEIKVLLPLDKRPELRLELGNIFDSQIAGGKRYDLAVEGRRKAHATMFDSHSVDDIAAATYAVDMTALIAPDAVSVDDYIGQVLTQFQDAVVSLKEKLS